MDFVAVYGIVTLLLRETFHSLGYILRALFSEVVGFFFPLMLMYSI